MTDKDLGFYQAWVNILEWMKEYAQKNQEAKFEKEADFPDYIYRMERPYDLPTTVMSASLSDVQGQPVLFLNASPRHSFFKEVIVHPYESHSYRKLTYNLDKKSLVEDKRVFTKEILFTLADKLFNA